MSNKPSVLDWLDDVLKDYIEFEEIASAIDPEFTRLYQLLDRWNKNIFPKEANEEGIEKFEELLNITPQITDTLDDRRYRIIAKLNAKLPYTEVQLRRILGGILGYDGFTLTVKDLILTISLAEDNNSKLNIIIELLKEIVPMNILIKIHQFILEKLGVYYAGCVKVGNTVRIAPYVQDEVKEEGVAYLGGLIKIGNTIRIKPNNE